MVIVILLGVALLLGCGLVVAVRKAAEARRELEGLEEAFAVERGHVVEAEPEPAPWSSFDLDALRDDDVDAVEGHDPFATLTQATAPITWNAASISNGSEPKPTTDLTPMKAEATPVAGRVSDDTPVIILVVGAGFLGTGMTAGVTTASRLRRAWRQIDNSRARVKTVEPDDPVSQARVITVDPDVGPAARPSFDPEATRDGIVVDEEHEPFPTQEKRESRVSWPRPRPRSNGSRPRQNGEPKPIEWRPPGDVAARR